MRNLHTLQVPPTLRSHRLSSKTGHQKGVIPDRFMIHYETTGYHQQPNPDLSMTHWQPDHDGHTLLETSHHQVSRTNMK